jgi:hypothetical protein
MNQEGLLEAMLLRQAKRAKSWLEESIWMEPCAGLTWWGDSQPADGSLKRRRKAPAKTKRSEQPKTIADFARVMENRKRS